MRILVAALAASLFTAASCMNFVNPPPFGNKNDFSSNPSFPEGSRVNVVWDGMEKGRPVTLTLTQLNGTEWMLPMEYLTQSVVDKTSYDWLVATGKDLKASNMFFFCIFYEGETEASANSHYFNITAKTVNQPSPSPSSSSTLSMTTSTSTTASTTTSSPTSSHTASSDRQSPSPEPASGGMSTGAKVGLGVGIPVALLAGLAVGFFLFRRHKQQKAFEAVPPASEHAFHGAFPHGGYYQDRVEGAIKSPVEMGQTERQSELDGGYYRPADGAFKYGHAVTPGAVHEMPAGATK